MNKYAVVMNDDANVEALTQTLGNMGAGNIQPAGMNILLVESDLELNLAAVDGVHHAQKVENPDKCDE